MKLVRAGLSGSSALSDFDFAEPDANHEIIPLGGEQEQNSPDKMYNTLKPSL